MRRPYCSTRQSKEACIHTTSWPPCCGPTASLLMRARPLRNALTLLRSLLAEADASAAQPGHLLAEQDLLGLNPQAPLERDLDVVQQAWKEVQRLATLPSEPHRTALFTQVQHALTLV